MQIILDTDIVPSLEGVNRGLNREPKRYAVIVATSRQITRTEFSGGTGLMFLAQRVERRLQTLLLLALGRVQGATPVARNSTTVKIALMTGRCVADMPMCLPS